MRHTTSSWFPGLRNRPSSLICAFVSEDMLLHFLGNGELFLTDVGCVCLIIYFWVALCLCGFTGFLLLKGAGDTLYCGVRASCSGFSHCRAQALSVWTSVVVVHRLSCSSSRGISLDQELNLCPLHWQADCYPVYHQGSPCIHIKVQPKRQASQVAQW